jgi:hypothetical protein
MFSGRIIQAFYDGSLEGFEGLIVFSIQALGFGELPQSFD